MKKFEDIEYPDRKFTVADHVICINCGISGLVTKGREDCPNCHMTSSLSWVDINKQEVEI